MAKLTNGQNAQPTLRGKWLIIGVIVALAVLVSAFVSLRPRRIRIVVTKPTRVDIINSITTNGKVEPINNFEAHATAPSTVKNIAVHEGQAVHKGQLLIQLDDSEARAQYAKALSLLRTAEADKATMQRGGTQDQVLSLQGDLNKAKQELESANRNLQTIRRLAEQGAAAQEELTTARTRVQRAQADVQLLKEKQTSRYSSPERAQSDAAVANAQAAVYAAQQLLDDLNVRAASDGTVYSIPVRQGAWVNTGDLLVQVANLDRLQVRAFVDEPEIGRLQPNQQIRVTWDALPGRTWIGIVHTVPTSIVQHGSRAVGELLCSVPNDDRRLLPNTNVSVTVITHSRAGAITLPREAVQDDNGKSVVYVVSGSHLSRREVQTGVVNLTNVEIRNGLSEQDTVAVQSLSPTPLTDGISFKIIENRS